MIHRPVLKYLFHRKDLAPWIWVQVDVIMYLRRIFRARRNWHHLSIICGFHLPSVCLPLVFVKCHCKASTSMPLLQWLPLDMHISQPSAESGGSTVIPLLLQVGNMLCKWSQKRLAYTNVRWGIYSKNMGEIPDPGSLDNFWHIGRSQFPGQGFAD